MIYHIGTHRVRHGNVADDLSVLMGDDSVNILYSDPPWGDGNLRYWDTINVKMNATATRQDRVLTTDELLARVLALAAERLTDDGACLVEYGVRWSENVKAACATFGLVHNGIINIRYRGGGKLLPLHLHVMSRKAMTLAPGWVASVTDTYGYDTPRLACAPFVVPGGVVFDPCCGLGYSAQVAVDNGMRFIGNELNMERLRKTIRRLKK